MGTFGCCSRTQKTWLLEKKIEKIELLGDPHARSRILPLKMAYRLLRKGLGSALAVVALLAASQAYALTNVSGTITANTTWDAASGPYVINGTVTIPAGVTLTLSPGTVVKGQTYNGFFVDGTLIANGTSALPIVFTSYKNDSYGGENWTAGSTHSVTWTISGDSSAELRKRRALELIENYGIPMALVARATGVTTTAISKMMSR